MTYPVLWASNAPWAPSGYGVQSKHFAPRIAKHGHSTAFAANYGAQAGVLNWGGLPVLPSLMDGHGRDVLTSHAAAFFQGLKKGGIIILYDSWVYDPHVLHKDRANVAVWAPVDHEPAPPGVLGFFEESGAIPLAMSQHGYAEFAEADLDPIYIPHAVDTKLFTPGDKADARQRIGLPDDDRFVVGMIAANKGNPSRKSFDQALQAFAQILLDHSDAILYLHTEADGKFDGVNLPALLGALKIPAENVRFADPYQLILGFPDDYMVAAYRAIDVLLNPAMGEGFGVPVLEAQACGTPVIVSEFTAMREIGQVGWQVGGQKTFTPMRSWMLTPDVGEIVEALLAAEQMRGRFASAGVDHAAKYDIDVVWNEYWVPALAEMGERWGITEQAAEAA